MHAILFYGFLMLSLVTLFETADSFGVSSVEAYSWKDLMDLDSVRVVNAAKINAPHG